MPDPGELAAIGVLGAIAVAWIARSLMQPVGGDGAEDDELALRHRAALEALHEVEADHRAGLLDEAAYRRERRQAEGLAVETLQTLRPESAVWESSGTSEGRRLPRSILVVAALLAAALVVGLLLPEPLSIANATQVDQRLAAAQQQEAARLATIRELLDQLVAEPRNEALLSQLADAYLAGTSREDLVRAATALQLLIALSPHDTDAHRRIVTAYIRAGDYPNAKAALAAFARLEPDPADVAFFRGLIALRGDGDARAAIAAFERFLTLAPDDARRPMVEALRNEAASQLAR